MTGYLNAILKSRTIISDYQIKMQLMELPNLMNTLSNVLNKLERKGIDKDFKQASQGFTANGHKVYRPDELTNVKVFRFEELKDPGDLSIQYLIEANDAMMGYILDAYGVYSSHDEDGFYNAMRLKPEKDHREQVLFELQRYCINT